MFRLYIFLLMCLIPLKAHSAQNVYNVGIYENKPKIFTDHYGNPSGFHVEILNYIAQKENFKINYIPCNWSQCLEMIQSGDLDIMPDVGYSNERAKKFFFSDETVLSSWSFIYQHKNSDINSILDLENKKIAVLKDSIQHAYIDGMLKDFDVRPAGYTEVNTWVEAFEFLQNKKVDILIVNRFYELSNHIGKNIERTDIVIMPTIIKFIFSKSQQHLMPIIDQNLKLLKNDKNSIYHLLEKKWLMPKKQTGIPQWVQWVFVGSMIFIWGLLVLIYVFKTMLNKKTSELLQKEQIILMQSRQASMGELIGNIAHQWRQPIAQLSAIHMNMKVTYDFNKFTKEYLNEKIKEANNLTKYMSNTISDFQNFFKPESQKERFSVAEVCTSSIHIMESAIRYYDIAIKFDIKEDATIYGYKNEYSQVFLNILSNAKDILIERDVQNPTIQIEISKDKKGYSIVSISDNGGGIPHNITDKIFEPYFTTRHKTQGTGIGLYMSKNIIERNMEGKVTARNGREGAIFTIKIKQAT